MGSLVSLFHGILRSSLPAYYVNKHTCHTTCNTHTSKALTHGLDTCYVYSDHSTHSVFTYTATLCFPYYPATLPCYPMLLPYPATLLSYPAILIHCYPAPPLLPYYPTLLPYPAILCFYHTLLPCASLITLLPYPTTLPCHPMLLPYPATLLPYYPTLLPCYPILPYFYPTTHLTTLHPLPSSATLLHYSCCSATLVDSLK